MNIINKILENKFSREKKTFENNKQQADFLNYSEIKSVLLLFNIKNDENIGIYEYLAKILKNDNKKVTLCGFVEQKKSLLPSLQDKIIIKKEEISFWQKPKKEILDNISAQNFDAVFLLTAKNSLPVLYALMHANTKIRCGGIPEPNLLDFIIDTSNIQFANETYIFENIVKYLKMINKNQEPRTKNQDKNAQL